MYERLSRSARRRKSGRVELRVVRFEGDAELVELDDRIGGGRATRAAGHGPSSTS